MLLIFRVFIFFIFLSVYCNAQEKVITMGFQFKPIIPNKFLRTGDVSLETSGVSFSMMQNSGFTAGMVIRRGFTKRLSLETGISYTKRNYLFSVNDRLNNLDVKSQFTIIGYELPTLGLVYIRLADKLYMNNAFGSSLNFFPSNVSSGDGVYIKQTSFRNSWIQVSLLANHGYELRTEKKGIFYLGASYHRPFTFIYKSFMFYRKPNETISGILDLSGNYFTIDFRYFFHEDPISKGRKKKSQ